MEYNNEATCDDFQTHVHEFLGSTMLGAPEDSPELLHNHRFAGVTGPVITRPGGHVHILSVNSDFFFNHFHQIEVETGPPILVRDQDGEIIGHVHGFSGISSCVFFHDHEFRAATLIQNPIGPMEMSNPIDYNKNNPIGSINESDPMDISDISV